MSKTGFVTAGVVKTGAAVLVLTVAMIVGFTAPASAEFFGCNDRTSTRTYTSAPPRYTRATTTHEYSAQSRTRHTYYRAGTKPPSRTTWSDRSRW